MLFCTTFVYYTSSSREALTRDDCMEHRRVYSGKAEADQKEKELVEHGYRVVSDLKAMLETHEYSRHDATRGVPPSYTLRWWGSDR